MFKGHRISLAILFTLTILGGFVLHFPVVNASGRPESKTKVQKWLAPNFVPSSPLGDFVLDNVIPYRATHWKILANEERWWPNTQRQGKLSGVKVLEVATGKYWIRAQASLIRWSQSSLNWILGHNTNPTRRIEVIFHTFEQDTNNCIGTSTTDSSNLIATNLPGGEQYSKPACFPFQPPDNEARVYITRPDLLVANQKYWAYAWFADDNPRDLGEIPLAFGWQNENHGNVEPDDNVKKLCFGADEGRSWGPDVFNGKCRDVHTAPVTLFSSQNYGGTLEGFTGNDHWLPDNKIGNDSTRSVKVKPGWQARLYENHSNGGLVEILNGDDNDLTNNAIGSDTSSVIVLANGAAVFEHENFAGVVEVFGNGCDLDLTNNLIGDNRITSVRVPPGWRLELYEHPNKGGKKLVFQGINDANIFDNKNFNDITSSLCAWSPDQQHTNGQVGDWTGTDD